MSATTLTANSQILAILRDSVVKPDGVTLQGTLDRQQYISVNKFLAGTDIATVIVQLNAGTA